jgi:fructose-1,6-bisphosphatase/inositol monophosphatase family enzyme
VPRYDDDLRFAHVLADAADDITTRRFRALNLEVETKPDLTPVTDADRAAEDSLRNVLRRSRPRDAVLGEEFGRAGHGPRCWVIDPIDGTKNFVRGVPVWATLIGLIQSVWRSRAYGDFWSHVLVAEGAVDVSAEPEVSLWDIAALQVIVEEAGGRFTDIDGARTPDGGSVVCTNGLLHEEVLARVKAP